MSIGARQGKHNGEDAKLLKGEVSRIGNPRQWLPLMRESEGLTLRTVSNQTFLQVAPTSPQQVDLKFDYYPKKN